MTNKQAIGVLNRVRCIIREDSLEEQALVYAIEVLKAQDDTDTNVDDTVYRQAAIDALTEYGNGRTVYIGVEEAIRRIEQLPSAQPEREPAKFIRWMECKKTDKYISYTPHCKCSKCGNELLIETINYCYMCGADMRGEQDE